MATDDKAHIERAKLAKEIYIAAIAHNGGSNQATQLAKSCFHYADAFAEIELLDSVGELEGPEDLNPFDDASAPNVPNAKNHPINLMSKKWGDIDKIRKHLPAIKELRIPVGDGAPPADSIVYEELMYTPAMANQARTMWPDFLARVERLQEKATNRKAAAGKLAK